MSAHGTRSKYARGCRCAECREANRVYVEQRRRAAGMQPRQPARHGSTRRYTNKGCRCDACTAANRIAKARWRARRRELGLVPR